MNILAIYNIFQYVAKNRFMIYAFIAAIACSLAVGGYMGWKIKGYFQASKNMKVIENDIETREKQDEANSISYDSSSFRNGILRQGRL